MFLKKHIGVDLQYNALEERDELEMWDEGEELRNNGDPDVRSDSDLSDLPDTPSPAPEDTSDPFDLEASVTNNATQVGGHGLNQRLSTFAVHLYTSR